MIASKVCTSMLGLTDGRRGALIFVDFKNRGILSSLQADMSEDHVQYEKLLMQPYNLQYEWEKDEFEKETP